MTLDDLETITGMRREAIRSRISQMDKVTGFYDSNGIYSYKYDSSNGKVKKVSSQCLSLDGRGKVIEAKTSFDVELKMLKDFFLEYGDCKHLEKFLVIARIPNTNVVIYQCGICNKTMDKVYNGEI